MTKVLRFRSRQQRREEFLADVVEQARTFEGTVEDRKRFIAGVVHRCFEMKLDKDPELIQRLEQMFSGFLDPEHDWSPP
jgi:hypothetical protein